MPILKRTEEESAVERLAALEKNPLVRKALMMRITVAAKKVHAMDLHTIAIMLEGLSDA